MVFSCTFTQKNEAKVGKYYTIQGSLLYINGYYYPLHTQKKRSGILDHCSVECEPKKPPKESMVAVAWLGTARTCSLNPFQVCLSGDLINM